LDNAILVLFGCSVHENWAPLKLPNACMGGHSPIQHMIYNFKNKNLFGLSQSKLTGPAGPYYPTYYHELTTKLCLLILQEHSKPWRPHIQELYCFDVP